MLRKQVSELKSFNYHKYYLILGGLLVMSLFGDSLLLFFGHSLHVFFEIITSLLEQGLQTAFDITERQAQIAVFYFGLITGSCITWRILVKTCRKCRALCKQANCRMKQVVDEANWLKIMFLFTALGTSVLIFT